MGVVTSFLGSDITCGCVTSHGVCDVILGVLRHMGVVTSLGVCDVTFLGYDVTWGL